MSNPAPGWYPDPAGSAQSRWWDGTTWTASLQPAAAPEAPAYTAPTAAVPSYGVMPAATPYSYAATRERSDADPTTPFVWVLALTPLVSLLTLAVQAAMGDFSGEFLLASDTIITPGTAVSYVIGFVSWLLGVLLAFLDHRELGNRGLTHRFSWAFAFIPVLAPLTYLIGRTVTVRGQTGRGLAPLITWIALTAATFLISVVVGIVAGVMAVSTLGF